jgi:hypothetical protein
MYDQIKERPRQERRSVEQIVSDLLAQQLA